MPKVAENKKDSFEDWAYCLQVLRVNQEHLGLSVAEKRLINQIHAA